MTMVDRRYPELWLAIAGFLVAFAWEMFQMPFYNMSGMTAWQVTKSCALASVGDAGIMVASAWTADRVTRGGLWAAPLRASPLVIYLAIGIAVTIAVERIALRSEWGWQYSDFMPTVLSVGMVPIAMWVVVPFVSLYLASRLR